MYSSMDSLKTNSHQYKAYFKEGKIIFSKEVEIENKRASFVLCFRLNRGIISCKYLLQVFVLTSEQTKAT